MEELNEKFAELQEMWDAFKEDHVKSLRPNNAAAIRARKVSVKMRNSLFEYRKMSAKLIRKEK